MHILRNVEIVPSVEFQGESKSTITIWFSYLYDVLFWEHVPNILPSLCMYKEGGLRMKVTCDINIDIA